MRDSATSAIADAVKALGGPAKAARRLGITITGVMQWTSEIKKQYRPVPPEHAVMLEFHTRIPVEQIRPDAVWVRVRRKGWPLGGKAPMRDFHAEAQRRMAAKEAA